MVRIWVRTEKYFYGEVGQVFREAPTRDSRTDRAVLEVAGDFNALLSYSHWEELRSGAVLWFEVLTLGLHLPDDWDRYNGFPVAIKKVPMRISEFDKLLKTKDLHVGSVSGVFRFNVKGPSLSLELVR